ncbi:FecR family protein [Chitinophaga arvensicola]|uniref:FecR protein n=1 Tax=Chitinophaga arvensicola TaxID=29529 RepID=A0A1I0RE54_9BACT|nr:FecR domain-containing protein [Chitinophaga arvensicola]SEW38888.1 FecR protein [Chitinophaga arvensicola]
MAADQHSGTNPVLQRIAYLINRYQQGILSATEEAELQEWTAAAEENRVFFEQLTDPVILQQKLAQYEKFDAAAGWATFSARQFPAATPVKVRSLYRWSAAAAVLLLLGAGVYFLRPAGHTSQVAEKAVTKPVLPGSSKALLTLADGSVIPLDSNGNQVISQQGAQIHLNNGQLQYNSQDYSAQTALNTLTTPRGGQFRLTLPDGTRVWLNAASAITYPTAFPQGTREVEVKGEVYFEVAALAKMPFKVKVSPHTSIDVLGTSFNINAYTDEPGIQTTLIQGAVKVNAGNVSRVLLPGQQALVSGPDQMKVVAHADTAAILAWKKEEFYFRDADIPTVMRQLGRWYDVTIVYAGAVPAGRFQGEIQRNLPLSDVLEGLESTGIHFRLQGRSIIVEPK